MMLKQNLRKLRTSYVYVKGVFYHWFDRSDKKSSYGKELSFKAGRKQKPVMF